MATPQPDKDKFYWWNTLVYEQPRTGPYTEYVRGLIKATPPPRRTMDDLLDLVRLGRACPHCTDPSCKWYWNSICDLELIRLPANYNYKNLIALFPQGGANEAGNNPAIG